MYAETEDSGHCHCKGMVQVRIAFYLESGDHRYEEFPVGSPCHNHFIYLEPGGTNAETEAAVEAAEASLLADFATKWNTDTLTAPYLLNAAVAFQQNPTQQRIDDCQAKVNHLKTKKLKKTKAKK
jgi:hypothetical protein